MACLLLSQEQIMFISGGAKGQSNERSQERIKSAKDSRGHWQWDGGTAFL
jgi:hypothetical protein